MNYPESLKKLIDSFKILPGIGEKTAERLAFSILSLDDKTAYEFSKSINDVKTKIKKCLICNNLTEEDVCPICSDKNRDNTTICVVEDAKT